MVDAIEGNTRDEKIAYLLEMHYDIIVKQKQGKFYLFIPELSMVSQGGQLSEAYDELILQKKRYFENLIDSGSQEEIIFPRRRVRLGRLWDQLILFVCKLCILCLLLGGTIIGSTILVMDKVMSYSPVFVVKQVTMGLLSEVGQLGKMGTLSEEDMEEKSGNIRQVIENIRQVVRLFRPVIDEFRTVELP